MVTEIDLVFKEGTCNNGYYDSFEEFKREIEDDKVRKLIKNNNLYVCIPFSLDKIKDSIIDTDDIIGTIKDINLDTMKATINFDNHNIVAMQYYNGLEDPVICFRKLGNIESDKEKEYSKIYNIRICGEIKERKSTYFHKEEINE